MEGPSTRAANDGVTGRQVSWTGIESNSRVLYNIGKISDFTFSGGVHFNSNSIFWRNMKGTYKPIK